MIVTKIAGEDLRHLDDRLPVELVVRRGPRVGVSASDASAEQRSAPASRTTFCSSRCAPSTSNVMPGFHSPDISTAPTTPASSRKFGVPSSASRGGATGSAARADPAAASRCGGAPSRPRRRWRAASPQRAASAPPARASSRRSHALEEADEKRRIAERRQRAADVADEQDEEHDGVHVVPARLVGGQQRPDQQHRRAGRAHDAGERGAERQQAGVERGGADERAAHADAAGDREQREQDGDERHVLQQQRVRDLVHAPRRGRTRPRTARAARSPTPPRPCRSARARNAARASGAIAIDSRSPAKGSPHSRGSVAALNSSINARLPAWRCERWGGGPCSIGAHPGSRGRVIFGSGRSRIPKERRTGAVAL